MLATILSFALAASLAVCLVLALNASRLRADAIRLRSALEYNEMFKKAWFLSLRQSSLKDIKEADQMIREGRVRVNVWATAAEMAVGAEKEMNENLAHASPNRAVEILAEHVPGIVFNVTKAEYFKEDADPEFRYLQDKYSFRMKQ